MRKIHLLNKATSAATKLYQNPLVLLHLHITELRAWRKDTTTRLILRRKSDRGIKWPRERRRFHWPNPRGLDDRAVISARLPSLSPLTSFHSPCLFFFHDYTRSSPRSGNFRGSSSSTPGESRLGGYCSIDLKEGECARSNLVVALAHLKRGRGKIRWSFLTSCITAVSYPGEFLGEGEKKWRCAALPALFLSLRSTPLGDISCWRFLLRVKVKMCWCGYYGGGNSFEV